MSQTGRTTKQMLDAPVGATFVWCNEQTHYPTRLARAINRPDLVIRPLSWLRADSIAGRRDDVVVDHMVGSEHQFLRYVPHCGACRQMFTVSAGPADHVEVAEYFMRDGVRWIAHRSIYHARCAPLKRDGTRYAPGTVSLAEALAHDPDLHQVRHRP